MADDQESQEPEIIEIPDKEIKDALKGYQYISPGDEVIVYLKYPVAVYGKKISGILFSVAPVFQIMLDGNPVSIRQSSIVMTTCTKRSDANRFAAITELREQQRKLDILNEVARGTYFSPIDDGKERKEKSTNEREPPGYT